MDKLREIALEQMDYMVDLRRFFHRNPELGWQERGTCARIRAELDAAAIPWEPAGETGTIATIQGGSAAPVIGLRADMDALPIQEGSDTPYASCIPGVMHACGHDAHMAILLGTARALQGMRERLACAVRLIFQPAEELVAGARQMAEHPLLQNLDTVAGLHVWSPLPVGEIAVRPGPCMASADTFEIEIRGESGHGSAPHTGVDAIYAASSLVNTLQSVVSRRTDPLEPAVVSIGTIQGGTAPNIIASRALLSGTIRCFSPALRKELPEKIERIVSHVTQALEAGYELRIIPGTPPVINDPMCAEIARDCAVLAAGRGVVGEMAPVTGSEDFAYYLERTPGVFAFVGCGSRQPGGSFPHHHERFDIDERALADGAAFFLHYVAKMSVALGKNR